MVIGNVEEHVQRAEAVMFPARKDEEDVWVQEVMKEIQPEKVSAWQVPLVTEVCVTTGTD